MFVGWLMLLSFPAVLWADEESSRTHLEDDSEFEFVIHELQPPPAATQAQTAGQPPRSSPARRRRPTYELPPMFGDNFGGGSYQALIQPPPVLFAQTITDGVGGFDLTVRNANGGPGADANPAVPITVFSNGTVIATSIGPGGGAPLTYPIGEPTIPGVSPPPAPGPGTLAFTGGIAAYGGTQNPVGDSDNWRLNFSHTFTPAPIPVTIPVGGAVGREKIADNNSPEPRSRLFWNYNYYNNVPGGINDVNRHTFGIEQPFAQDMCSWSLRVPFAATLDSDQTAGGLQGRNTQFGDIMAIGKAILWENDYLLVSLGMGVSFPTADDSRVFNAGGAQIMSLEHRSVRLQPFLAAMRGYESGWYWQSFLQVDMPTNGDVLNMDLAGRNLQTVGVLQEQTLLFCDVGVGKWIIGGPLAAHPSVAATAELHLGSTVQNADSITRNDLTITTADNRYDVLNFTTGLNIMLTNRFTIRPAFVVPLNDHQFDSEAMVQANFLR